MAPPARADALLSARGVSKQELVRQLVLDESARLRRRTDVDAVLDVELPRYAVALERLGR